MARGLKLLELQMDGKEALVNRHQHLLRNLSEPPRMGKPRLVMMTLPSSVLTSQEIWKKPNRAVVALPEAQLARSQPIPQASSAATSRPGKMRNPARLQREHLQDRPVAPRILMDLDSEIQTQPEVPEDVVESEKCTSSPEMAK